MKIYFQNFVLKYYNFIKKMNHVLKFNELIQYKNLKYMKLGVYMSPASKL